MRLIKFHSSIKLSYVIIGFVIKKDSRGCLLNGFDPFVLEAVTDTCIGKNWINFNIGSRADELAMCIIGHGDSCITF